MKFSFAISALACLGSTAAMKKADQGFGSKVDVRKLKMEHDFMQAMHADGKIASAHRKNREQARKRKLYENLVKAAIPKEEYDKQRKLDQNSEYDMGDSYEWMNPVYQQMVEDGVFDLTARSFKYSGCAAIKSFDSDNAANTGVPMSVQTYAVFRLCPENSCNKYSLTGCGKNYGEYVVEMSTYLEFMLDFYEDHYGAYCDYCYSCDYNYQVMKKQFQGECYENMAMADYDMEQQQQEMAWEDYYQQNFGDMSQYMSQKQNYQQQMQQQMNNYGNRKLDGYYSDFTSAYSSNSGNSGSSSSSSSSSGSYGNNDQGSNNYSWINGGQANGQAYYNMMNQQVQYQNGQRIYGYVDDSGAFVNLCDTGSYTDSNGNTVSVNCDQYESKMLTCSDGSLCDYCEYQVDQNYEPCDEYVCKDYYTYCSDLYEPQYKHQYSDNNGGNNGQQQYNYKDAQEQNSELYAFLDCTEYVNQYGQQYYVGPHCGSDHYTISLGVFTDENCVNFAGETVSLSKVLGYGYDDESFFHLPHECISCDGAQQFQADQEQYNEMYTGQGVYGDYVEAPNSEFDDVVGMCAALFERSAQCNIHMSNYGMMSKYMEEIDAAFEQRYCAFIDNIVYGTYDEMGEIKLKSDTFDFNDWRNPEQYKKMTMPASQAIGLALSILLTIALAAMAFVTQRSLTRKGTPWRPRRFKKSVEVEQGFPNPTPPLI